MCVDCGTVLDSLLGWDGGLGRFRWRRDGGDDLATLPPAECLLPPPAERIRERVREKITRYLSLFHLDNSFVLERVVDNFQRVYGARESGRNRFRKTEYLERVAIGFSICNVLAKERFPRPPAYIASICGIEKCELLNIVRSLHLDKALLDTLNRDEYELTEIEAQDYVTTVCDIMNLPFHVGTKIHNAAERVQAALPGRFPSVLAAVAFKMELPKSESHLVRQACYLLGCKEPTVNRTHREALRELANVREKEEDETADPGHPRPPADSRRREVGDLPSERGPRKRGSRKRSFLQMSRDEATATAGRITCDCGGGSCGGMAIQEATIGEKEGGTGGRGEEEGGGEEERSGGQVSAESLDGCGPAKRAQISPPPEQPTAMDEDAPDHQTVSPRLPDSSPRRQVV